MTTSSRDVSTAMLTLCLAAAVMYLLYVDWKRHGELELLHDRVDGLERWRNQGYVAAMKVRAPQSDIERILSADDDRTLADIARGNA